MAKTGQINGRVRKRPCNLLFFRVLSATWMGLTVAFVLIVIWCVMLEAKEYFVGR
jgi:hypothetical protein